MGIRVQALNPGYTYTEFHDTPDYEGFDRAMIPDSLWMSSEEVVAASLVALDGNKVIVIPGRRNRILAWSLGKRVQPLVARWILGIKRR